MGLHGLRQVRWTRCAWWNIAATSLFALTALGLLAHAAYALWIHATDPCEDLLYSLSCRDKLYYFGSKQGEVIGSSVVAGISSVLCLTWLAHQLPRLLSCCHALADAGFDLWGSARELLARLSRKACMFLADPERDPDAGRIRREFERQRVRRLQSMAHASCPVFVGVLLYVLIWLFFLRIIRVPTPGRELYWMFLFDTGVVPLMIPIACVVAIDLYPSVVTPRFVDFSGVLCTIASGWMLAVSYTGAYHYHHHYLTATRFMQIFYLGNAPLSVGLNVVTFAIECANVAIRPEVLDTPRLNEFYRDLLVFGGASAIAYALEQFLWGEARLVVRVKKSDQTSDLVQRLLDRMCDAVPRLDMHLCLAEPCPSLATLVLRGGPIPQGMRFVDLISPEDSEHFRVSLAGPASTAAQRDAPRPGVPGAGAAAACALEVFAGLCHVRLRAAGGLLPASVFYSCIPDVDGLPTFLLGIREDREEGGAPGAAAVAELPSPPAQLLTALPEAGAVDAEDRSSSAWSSVSDDEGAEAQGAMSVWVDSADHDLRVLSCSPGFALVGGATGPCTSLSEWLSDSAMSQIWTAVDVPANRHRVRGVKLSPPGGTSYRCSVHVRPRAAMPPALEEAAAAGAEPVRIDFRVREASMQRRQERDVVKEAFKATHRDGPLQALRSPVQPQLLDTAEL